MVMLKHDEENQQQIHSGVWACVLKMLSFRCWNESPITKRQTIRRFHQYWKFSELKATFRLWFSPFSSQRWEQKKKQRQVYLNDSITMQISNQLKPLNTHTFSSIIDFFKWISVDSVNLGRFLAQKSLHFTTWVIYIHAVISFLHLVMQVN